MIDRARALTLRPVRGGIALAALLGVFGVLPAVQSSPIPLPPVEQQLVNQAVDIGADYLSKNQQETGTWAKGEVGAGNKVGYTAFPGLTLLACGVPPSDPVIKKAAAFVRANVAELTNTYELSLAIMFLDRLNDRKDRPLIQKLALRVIAAQTPTGGWLYTCPVLKPEEQAALLDGLRRKKFVNDFRPVLCDPAKLPLVEQKDAKEVYLGTTDNSCTQFATLAVWAARRHKIPVDRTLRLITRRFSSSQNKTGGWGYAYAAGGGAPEGGQYCCAGLLGLALGHKLDKEDAPRGKALFLAAGQALADTAFPSNSSRVAAVAMANQIWNALQGAKKQAQDQKITSGFNALNQYVGAPTGRMKDHPMPNLYFLWSVERAAVLFGLPTVGGKDWYRWGAEQLVANQKPDGHWEGSTYPGSSPTIDTCLALLFLKRANLASGLTTAIKVQPKEPVKPVIVEPAPVERKTPVPTPQIEEPKARTTPVEEKPKVVAPPVVAKPTPPPEEKADPSGGIPLPLILGGGGLLVVLLGAGAFFLLRKNAAVDDEEDEPSSKAQKKKKAKVAFDDEANGEDKKKSSVPAKKKRATAIVEDEPEAVEEIENDTVPAKKKKAKLVFDDEPEAEVEETRPQKQLKPKKRGV
jgi:hypothetical protein